MRMQQQGRMNQSFMVDEFVFFGGLDLTVYDKALTQAFYFYNLDSLVSRLIINQNPLYSEGVELVRLNPVYKPLRKSSVFHSHLLGDSAFLRFQNPEEFLFIQEPG
jgi:hypothetical protein